jgi:hypothetical protein
VQASYNIVSEADLEQAAERLQSHLATKRIQSKIVAIDAQQDSGQEPKI